jgi:TPR repeat protein
MTRTTWLATQAAIFLVAFGPLLPSFAAHADEVPIRLSADLDLTAAQQSSLAIQAMKGSPEAALKLATFHFIVRGDREASLKWYTIGAENGDPACAHNLAGLLMVSSDEQEHARGIFWLHKAADGGAPYAKDELKEMESQAKP